MKCYNADPVWGRTYGKIWLRCVTHRYTHVARTFWYMGGLSFSQFYISHQTLKTLKKLYHRNSNYFNLFYPWENGSFTKFYWRILSIHDERRLLHNNNVDDWPPTERQLHYNTMAKITTERCLDEYIWEICLLPLVHNWSSWNIEATSVYISIGVTNNSKFLHFDHHLGH